MELEDEDGDGDGADGDGACSDFEGVDLDDTLRLLVCHEAPGGAPSAWFVGAVNGGVWRTKDGMGAAKPHWVPVTDSPAPVRCQSIGALTTGSAAGAGCSSST